MMRTTHPKGVWNESVNCIADSWPIPEGAFFYIYLDIFLLPVNRSMNIFNAHLIRYPICLQSGPFLRI
jgi:hypothetical protein